MSDTEKTQSRKTAASTDLGQDEVQQAFDEAREKGYFGVTPDPTPNENYTIKGVTKNAPTPETDDALADELAANQRKLAREGKL
jgi:hypothetical protein